MMVIKHKNSESKKWLSSRIKRWAALFFISFLTWAFIFYIGPWIQDSIPIMKQMAQVAEERDIDITAFFYTDTETSYDGERYLRNAIKLSAPEEAGLTGPFIIGVILCFVILGIGYRFLPND